MKDDGFKLAKEEAEDTLQRQDDQLEPIYNSSVPILCLEDLPGAMGDRVGWREMVREIRSGGVT